MANNQKATILSLPKRFLNLSVEFGEEPDLEIGGSQTQNELIQAAEQKPVPAMRLIDLITFQPEMFKPLLDEKSSTDPNIIQAFENGLPPKLSLKTNLVSFFWLTGTTFKDVKTHIAELKDIVMADGIPPLLTLKPDPMNRYDPDCIEVHNHKGNPLGYVPKKDGINKEVGLHLKEEGRLIAVQIAMIDDGRKGNMLAAACGWMMPPELLIED